METHGPKAPGARGPNQPPCSGPQKIPRYSMIVTSTNQARGKPRTGCEPILDSGFSPSQLITVAA